MMSFLLYKTKMSCFKIYFTTVHVKQLSPHLPAEGRTTFHATLIPPPACLGTRDFHAKQLVPHHPFCYRTHDFPREA